MMTGQKERKQSSYRPQVLHNFSSKDMLRLMLPYGTWICKDSSEFLFNRDYRPIYERKGLNTVATLVPDYPWVPWYDQYYFYNDACSIFDSKKTRIRAFRVLEDFILGRPVNVDKYVNEKRW